MLREIWEHIVNDPLYLAILLAAVVQFGVLLSLTLAVLITAGARQWMRLAEVKTRAVLTGPIMAALEDPNHIPAFVKRARRLTSWHVRRFLLDLAQQLTDERQQRLVMIYQAMGFVEIDLRHARSSFRFERVLAAKRLITIRTPASRVALLDLVREHGPIGLMALEGICAIGQPEDIIRALKQVRVISRVTRAHIVRCLEGTPVNVLLAVLAHVSDFSDPQIRRVVLETCAKGIPQESVGALLIALRSREKEDRLGGAVGLARTQATQALTELWNHCTDPEWEVRAAVANALGVLGHPASVPYLARMLDDFSFWVRNNAARALAKLGDAGREQLRDILDTHVDKFARDAARDALESISLARMVGR